MIKKIAVLFFIGFFAITLQAACGKSDKKCCDKKEEKQKTATNIKVTFVELGSVKCIPCKKMQPIMDAIEKEYKDQVKVVFHDVWTSEGKPFASKYKIKLIPTQIFLDSEGNEYFRHEGFFPKEEILKILKMKGVEL